MPTVGMAANMREAHHSKPVTKAQKVMSKRHYAHRESADAMPGKTLRDKIKKAKTALAYDRGHAAEHKKSEKDQHKTLKKLLKMRVKAEK